MELAIQQEQELVFAGSVICFEMNESEQRIGKEGKNEPDDIDNDDADDRDAARASM
jgi:hypothetical protein